MTADQLESCIEIISNTVREFRSSHDFRQLHEGRDLLVLAAMCTASSWIHAQEEVLRDVADQQMSGT